MSEDLDWYLNEVTKKIEKYTKEDFERMAERSLEIYENPTPIGPYTRQLFNMIYKRMK